MDEEIPYLSSGRSGASTNVSERDERDFSTLLRVKQDLDLAIEGLYKDFNAFDLTAESTEEAKTKMLLQIAGKQEAYSILVPLQNQIDSVIDEIRLKEKR